MFLQISSGLGAPAECELAVAKFTNWLKANYAVEILHTAEGRNRGDFTSAVVSGDEGLRRFIGTVQWICKSPYRPNHGRKNWFIDVSEFLVSTDTQFDESKVTFQTFRSSGAGGQHVNKTESGVRAIYTLTNDSTVCTKERSQHQNKQMAIEQLKAIIALRNNSGKAATEKKNWANHNSLERGNPVAVFLNEDFELKNRIIF